MPDNKEIESPIRVIKTALGLVTFTNSDLGGDIFKLLDSLQVDINDINESSDEDEEIIWSETTTELMEELKVTIIDELKQIEGEIDDDVEDETEESEVEAREEEDENEETTEDEDEDEKETSIRTPEDLDEDDDEDEIEGRDFEDDDDIDDVFIPVVPT